MRITFSYEYIKGEDVGVYEEIINFADFAFRLDEMIKEIGWKNLIRVSAVAIREEKE
jgi:hypothetical protein